MARYTPRSPRRKKTAVAGYFWLILLSVALLFSGIMVFQYRHGIRNFLYARLHKNAHQSGHTGNLQDVRNIELMHRFQAHALGIDVSHYQGSIDWNKVGKINELFDIDFVMVRATMGSSDRDNTFRKNWDDLRKKGRIRGAYHYYRPDEPSLEQAHNFISTVRLLPGDLPPVLDIEALPTIQSLDRLKVGLQRWLDEVERHYGVRPVIYTGQHYHEKYLEQDFKGYEVWIANYNNWIHAPEAHWKIWQFSEKGYVQGISGPVDLNLYNGDRASLERMRIREIRSAVEYTAR